LIANELGDLGYVIEEIEGLLKEGRLGLRWPFDQILYK
jgi:hypothetical protein